MNSASSIDGEVVEVGFALWPQIDDDIEESAARAAHELCHSAAGGYWKCMPRQLILPSRFMAMPD